MLFISVEKTEIVGDTMSIEEELKELYKKKEEFEYKIEAEKAERIRYGSRGSVQDVRMSQEREKMLKDKLNDVNERIDKLENQKKNGVIPFGNGRHSDFLNGIDEGAIVEGVIDNLGLNPKGNQKVEVTNSTTVKVTEDFGDGCQNVKQYSQTTTQNLGLEDGKKILLDKSAQIEFILREMKDGVELSAAAKRIDVSMNDVNQWLCDGENGNGKENIVFYNEIKQLGNSQSQNEINIKAKKVEDTKKHNSPRKKHNIKKNADSRGKNGGDEKKKKTKSPSKNHSNKFLHANNGNSRVHSTDNLLWSNANSNLKGKYHEKMNKVIRYMKMGKSKYLSCNAAGLTLDEFDELFDKGKNGYSDDTVNFYKEISKLNSSKSSFESSLKYSDGKSSIPKRRPQNTISSPKLKPFKMPDEEYIVDSNVKEKREMDAVLSCLKKDKSFDEAAKKVGISPNLIRKWRHKGINKVNENTIYFYNELQKIYSDASGKKNSFKSSDNSSNPSNESMQKDMKKVISYMESGYNKREAAKLANVDYNQILSWYVKGLKNSDYYSKNFYRMVVDIENKNKINGIKKAKSSSKIKSSNSRTSNCNFQHDNGLVDKYYVPNIKNGSSSASVKRNYFYKSKYVNSDGSRKIKKKTTPPKSDFKEEHRINPINNDSKKQMADIILFMSEGYDRMEAVEKAGVGYEVFVGWYRDGLKNRNKETRNFFRQIKNIENGKKL